MLVQGFRLPVLLILLVSVPERTSVEQRARPPANCATTRADDSNFVPPPPYAPVAPFRGRFWYGTEALWAMPSADGLWHGLVTPQGIGNKVFWWSREWDWRHDMKPELTVTARRLDADAPSVRVSPATNAHNAADIHHAMLVGLNIPMPGCWELTGEYKGHTLSYVVWVP
jgi:hypothetical protein